jgi:tripartite-type tricarboxylate transporter receptor subunit TctC
VSFFLSSLLRGAGKVAGLAFLVVTAATQPALATQPYPTEPVRVLVGYTAGGAGDLIARLAASKFSEVLGQSFVVENRPGASATIAAAAVARAKPDGYTLFVNTAPDSAIAPVTMADRIQYNVARDFEPIGRIVVVPSVLVVRPDSPFNSVADIIAYAKKNPGKLTYASFGNGTSAHMSAELLKSMAGIDIMHVPFKGSAPALSELLAGRVDILFDTFASAFSQVKAGKLRALGVTSAQRVPEAQDIPTMSEQPGLKGFVSQSFIGVVAPAGIPDNVKATLSTALQKIMSMPEVRDRIVKMGMVPLPSTPEEYKAFIASETDRNEKLIKAANIKFD